MAGRAGCECSPGGRTLIGDAGRSPYIDAMNRSVERNGVEAERLRRRGDNVPALWSALSLALSLAMALTLGACGGGGTTEPDGETTFTFSPTAQGQQLAVGQSREFSASVSQGKPLTVTWRLDGAVVGTDPQYVYGAQSVGRDTLRVYAESGTDARDYFWVIDVASAPLTVPPQVPGVALAAGPEPVEVVVTWSRIAVSTYPIVAYEIVMSYDGAITIANWGQAIALAEVPHVPGQAGYSRTFSREDGALQAGANAWFGIRARDDHGQLSASLNSRSTRITTEWWIDGRVVDDDGEPILGVITASALPVRNDNSDGEGRFRLGPYRSIDSVSVATTPPVGFYAFRTGKVGSDVDVSLEIVLPRRHPLAPECSLDAYGGDYLRWWRQMTRTSTSPADTSAARLWKWDHWPVSVFLPDSTLAGGRDMDQLAREMIALWNQALGEVYLVEASSAAGADIHFAWVTDASAGYGETALELPAGGVLGDVRPERVRVEVETGLLTDQFFSEVSLHELGHALGLCSHSLECDGAGHLMVLGASGNLLLDDPIHPDEVRAVRLVRRLPQGADMRGFDP